MDTLDELLMEKYGYPVKVQDVIEMALLPIDFMNQYDALMSEYDERVLEHRKLFTDREGLEEDFYRVTAELLGRVGELNFSGTRRSVVTGVSTKRDFTGQKVKELVHFMDLYGSYSQSERLQQLALERLSEKARALADNINAASQGINNQVSLGMKLPWAKGRTSSMDSTGVLNAQFMKP